jgi:hypothetical protein
MSLSVEKAKKLLGICARHLRLSVAGAVFFLVLAPACAALRFGFNLKSSASKSIWSAARQWQGAQKSLASACGGQPSPPKSP